MVHMASKRGKPRTYSIPQPTYAKKHPRTIARHKRTKKQHYLDISEKCGKSRIASINDNRLSANRPTQTPTMMLNEERLDISRIQGTYRKNRHARNNQIYHFAGRNGRKREQTSNASGKINDRG